MKVKIQLALDLLDLERAINIARSAADYVDIIEAGTPLIKSEGLDAVRELRKAFPDKLIVADMKIMDAGRIEVESAAKSGADIVDVCAQASDATILECVEAAKNYGCTVVADLIACDNPLTRAKRVCELGVGAVAVHTAIDDQMRAANPFETIRDIRAAVDVPIYAAGGLNSETVAKAVEAGADVLIIGGAITKATDVAKAAQDIRRAVDERISVASDHFVRSEDVRSVLAKVSSSNVSDALHRQASLEGLRPLVAGVRALGPAVTCRSYPGDWAKPVEAIDVANEGDVIVITTGGVGPAVWGELATESAMRKGISAVVIDGAVRDSDEIRALGFPTYSRLVVANAGEPKGFGEINVPIKISNIEINPGDWILCDGDGVMVIPKAKAVDVANRAADILERENRLRAEIRQGSSLGQVGYLKKWEKT